MTVKIVKIILVLFYHVDTVCFIGRYFIDFCVAGEMLITLFVDESD